MKLEHQVVSLDLAKRLKELGVKQESQFYWRHPVVGERPTKHWIAGGDDEPQCSLDCCYGHNDISAFTVAELGEMLPFALDNKLLKTGKCADGGWLVFYEQFSGARGTETIEDQEGATEADARAKCLIYLLQNRLITL